MDNGLERLVFAFFNAEIAAQWAPKILEGVWVTILVSLAVVATGLALGLALAALRAYRFRTVNVAIVAFVDILRALPPLVVIIILFFAFPYLDLPMSAFTATWLSLSLVLAAFAEEIWWAGICAVPRGQWEAARSTGLGFGETLGYVVLPQAVRMTVPPLVNRVIAVTKGTALGSVVALSEIVSQASSAASLAGNPTPLTLGAAAYLAIFVPVVVLGRWLETRFAWKR